MEHRAADVAVAGATGVVLGVGLLAGATLLMHPGPGALATAGFLIALSLAALAAALWVGEPEGRVRGGRRWVGAVVAFLIAGPFAELWVRDAAIREAAWGRALAVLILLALPAYGVGSVLVLLQRRERGTAVAALAGAAVGALLAAAWLIPNFDPGITFAASAIFLIIASWVEGVMGGGRSRTGEGRAGPMEGKVAIITGSGVPGQMGYALAEAFLARGANAVMTARGPEVERLARELSERAAAVGVAADLTRAEEAERVVEVALREFGRLDIVVNVAGGLTVIKPLAETTTEEWSAEVERNARTAFLMSRAALPALRESRGTIINFASPAGLRARPGIGAYSAAKAAVVALTRALALEEKEHGVRVNAVAPGLIDTEENRAAIPDPDGAAWVTREEVVEVVLFLASQRSAGVNGETIKVVGEGL